MKTNQDSKKWFLRLCSPFSVPPTFKYLDVLVFHYFSEVTRFKAKLWSYKVSSNNKKKKKKGIVFLSEISKNP